MMKSMAERSTNNMMSTCWRPMKTRIKTNSMTQMKMGQLKRTMRIGIMMTGTRRAKTKSARKNNLMTSNSRRYQNRMRKMKCELTRRKKTVGVKKKEMMIWKTSSTHIITKIITKILM